MTTACVYRHLDEWGRLLYVGRTGRIEKRTAEHSKSSSWFGSVASIAMTHCASCEEAARIEAEMIRDLDPPYNKALVFRRDWMRAAYQNLPEEEESAPGPKAETESDAAEDAAGSARSHAQIVKALKRVPNVAAFSRRHKLAERTVWNVRQGLPARSGTLLQIDGALNAEASK